MEILTVITNILLVIVTAVYVYLTYKLLVETNKSNTTQFRLLTFPNIHCGIFEKEGNLYLEIYNNGNTAAYDIDVMALPLFTEDDIKLKTFIDKYINPEFKKEYKGFKLDAEGFFALYDRFYYYCMPSAKKVTTRVHIPIKATQLYMHLQFRDVLGDNYGALYWFTESLENISRSNINQYKLASIDPMPIVVQPRVDMPSPLSSESITLIAENNKKIPSYLNDFKNMFEHSIPTGYIDSEAWKDLEDSGSWTDIK